MQFEGAVIQEQGVTFAVAVVRRGVLSSSSQRDQALRSFTGVFDGLPTILMEQDAGGTPQYYGRTDLVNFMASVPMDAVPWRRYTLN